MARFDTAQPIVHPLPDPDKVEWRAGLVYARVGGRDMAMDVYLPAGLQPTPLPAVLLVHGEADPALLRGVREWGQYTGWGRLLAAEGLAGIAFEHRAIAEAGFDAVVAEVGAALATTRDRAAELGLDPERLAIAGFSAGVPLAAVALAGAARRVRCAVLLRPARRLGARPGAATPAGGQSRARPPGAGRAKEVAEAKLGYSGRSK